MPLHFARAWAESTVGLLKAASLKRAALHRLEDEPAEADPATDPALQRAVRDAWTTECMLILSAAQLESWIRVLFRARDRRVPDQHPSLTALRNAVEHLDEAVLDDEAFIARPRTPKARKSGVGALPGGQLRLYVAEDEKLLGVITAGELDALANGLLNELAREDEEWLTDMMEWAKRTLNGHSLAASELPGHT